MCLKDISIDKEDSHIPYFLVGKINTEQIVIDVINIIKKSRVPLAPVWGEDGYLKNLPITKTNLP